MSLPAFPIGVYDSEYGVWVPLDNAALRIRTLGVREGKSLSTTVTVKANTTESDWGKAYENTERIFVIKKVVIPSGVSECHIRIDDNYTTIIKKTGEVDLEAEYGAKLYGSKIEVKVKVGTAPSSDTNYTVEIRGFETVKVTIPRLG